MSNFHTFAAQEGFAEHAMQQCVKVSRASALLASQYVFSQAKKGLGGLGSKAAARHVSTSMLACALSACPSTPITNLAGEAW